MFPRSALVACALLLTISLAGCASRAGDGGVVVDDKASEASPSIESTPPPEGVDAAAREQTEAWLDAATLPPGAVRSDESINGFNSYTGWPCGPVEELEAFWTIPDTTVPDTANWLMQNPTADLIATTTSPVPEIPIDSASVGYIPEPGAQEGIVYTVMKTGDGVAVRAEIAALTESGSCPALPDGGTYGAPGQG